MAFPSIATQANGAQTSNSTSWSLTYPSGLASGDLIVAIIGIDGTSTALTWPSGFVSNAFASTANALCWAKKLSDGTETGNFSVTTPSEQGVWQVLRIIDWEGTLGTTFNNATGTAGSVVAVSQQSSSTTPDAPVLDPSTWATEDTLWLNCASSDGTVTFDAKDANYTYVTNSPATSGGAGGAGLAVSWRQDTVSSENPAAYTLSASEQWSAATIGVRPSAGGAPERVPFTRPMIQIQAQ